MGRICIEQALSMMRHYFQQLPKDAEQRLR
ncbi:hypothetical protein HaLaN_24303, partial [Haematococcus lacustris]